MKFGVRLLVIVLGATLYGAIANAQVATNITRMNLKGDAAAVWSAVDKQWGRSGCCGRENLMQNNRWLDLLADEAVVWFWGQPSPMEKGSLRMWAEATETPEYESTRIAYELYPQGVAIHGNTAVAHYRYKVSSLDKQNKMSTTEGRYTDILVRDRPGADWKLLSWVGGGLPKQ